ncbi:MAG: UDP-N-acetylmuramate dehydrogenase [Phocaeicola sp.]|uniref:UDP-N-acetylmuramate dehydrogenase n=1 Tax=Phocaeicola TaxID=909656 RepID=UPI0030101CD9
MAINVQHNYSLLGHNTFGMDVRADEFISYDSEDELKEVLKSHPKERPVFHIGQGSNLLFTKDYKGTILHSNIRFIELKSIDEKGVFCRVGSGFVWDDFCDDMAKKKFYGVENLSYIPGEVGAAAIQNIGAYGAEVCNVISQVEAVEISTGKKRIFTNKECCYGYRDSIFKNELWRQYIVTAVLFHLSVKPEVKLDYGQLKDLKAMNSVPSAEEIREAVIAIRKNKLPDPSVLGSAGSFFKNPVVSVVKYEELKKKYEDIPHYIIDSEHIKIPAAWMIEQCGWKGRSMGGAAIYEKQSLIIVNQNHAKPEDVILLAEAVQKSVYARFGIEIYPEVNYV